ncbi:MAG: transketolase [Armatimonadetes bacterium]|nr:transketolase [Armatimonadota bacterium]
MRDTFVKRLTELAREDSRIMLVTGDLGFGVLTSYAAELPAQYLNAGVAEQNMTGMATGMAMEGRIVFTYSIANFTILRCLEQLRNDAAYHGASVKAVAIGGGFSYGALGMSHHATEDLAIMRAIPDIDVLAPCCPWEVENITSALAARPGTAYLRLDKSSPGRTDRAGEAFELGKARTLREGTDLTIAAIGGILEEALAAAASLAEDGIECRVIAFHSLSPFDREAVVACCSETGGLLTVEEHQVSGGLAGAVAEASLEAGVTPKVFGRIGLRDTFSSVVGSQQYLRQRYGLDRGSIATTAKRLLSR